MESVKVYVWKLGYVCAEYQSGEDLRFFSGGGDAAAVCDDRSDLEAGRGIAGEEGQFYVIFQKKQFLSDGSIL